MTDIHPPTPSLLTKTELELLMGKKKVSKVYEYRIRSDIKKKLQFFQASELPLLIHNGFINELSVFTQLRANTQSNVEQLSLENNPISNEIHLLPYEKNSLGREQKPHFESASLTDSYYFIGTDRNKVFEFVSSN